MQWEWLFDSPYPVCVSLLQQGVTALYFACKHGYAHIVNLLLEKGANINEVRHQLIYCNISTYVAQQGQLHVIIVHVYLATLILYRVLLHQCTEPVREGTWLLLSCWSVEGLEWTSQLM